MKTFEEQAEALRQVQLSLERISRGLEVLQAAVQSGRRAVQAAARRG